MIPLRTTRQLHQQGFWLCLHYVVLHVLTRSHACGAFSLCWRQVVLWHVRSSVPHACVRFTYLDVCGVFCPSEHCGAVGMNEQCLNYPTHARILHSFLMLCLDLSGRSSEHLLCIDRHVACYTFLDVARNWGTYCRNPVPLRELYRNLY